MNVAMTRKDAVDLFVQGSQALSRITSNGIRVDMDALNKASKWLDGQIEEKMQSLMEHPFAKEWTKRYGARFSLRSTEQLADILFNYAGFSEVKSTNKGNPCVDASVLERLYDTTQNEFLGDLIELRKLEKAKGTYLALLYRETNDDGFLHPFFRLDSVVSYRSSSCLAKGTLILKVDMKDYVIRFVPIQEIKAGDFVVSINEDFIPVIGEVEWAGQTGIRRCCALEYRTMAGHDPVSHLICTPDHRVRMIDGFYMFASQAGKWESFYRHFTDPNLNAMMSCEALFKNIHQYISTNNGYEKRVSDWIREQTGERIPKRNSKLFKSYTRYRLLRIITKTRGLARSPYLDTKTIRRHCTRNDIDFDGVRLRFNKKGEYFSRGKLRRLILKYYRNKHGLLERMGMGLIHFSRLCAHYQMQAPGKRLFKEAYTVRRVEYLPDYYPVFDISVKTYHNFIANGICVHNSNPNFQNFPNRDPLVKKVIRGCLYPRKGRQLVELDYSGCEVRTSYCYHKDPKMREYLLDPSTDMHRDMAKQIFVLNDNEWNKPCRQAAKNQFVFPEFYGSYYKQVAPALWNYVTLNKIKIGKNSDGPSVIEHLRGLKIGTLLKFTEHVRKIEEHFWGTRFKVYNQWKKIFYEAYLQNGFFDSYTGFRYSGVFKRNDVLNYAVQGSAFHCLLKTVIFLQRWLNKHKMSSLIVGQIHDSVVIDCVPQEIPDIVNFVLSVVEVGLPKAFPWLTIPMVMDGEKTEIDAPWSEKKGFDMKKMC